MMNNFKRDLTSGWRIASIMVILISSVAAWAKPATTYYELKVSSDRTPKPQIIKLWKSGEYFKQEISGSAKGKSEINIRNKDGYFNVLPWAGMAMKYPGDIKRVAHPRIPGPVGDVKAFLKQKKATSKGKKSLRGVMCEVWEYSATAPANGTCRLWVNTKNGQPVQLTYSHGKVVETATYVNYKTGIPIAESTFKVPTGMQRPIYDAKQ